jgi:hypothetical protein
LRLSSSYFAGDDAREMKRNKTGSDERNEFGYNLWYNAGHRSRSRLRSRLRWNERRSCRRKRVHSRRYFYRYFLTSDEKYFEIHKVVPLLSPVGVEPRGGLHPPLLSIARRIASRIALRVALSIAVPVAGTTLADERTDGFPIE